MRDREQSVSALRVAILTPTGKDAQLTSETLRHASIECFICADVVAIEQALPDGLGCLLVAEEALDGRNLPTLKAAFSSQPAWSDIPILLLTRYGADSATVVRALEILGNVTLLERPLRPATLYSVVRSALKARERQYQVRDHLLERERIAEILREADRRKDEFLAMLAHELRNPLAPIRTGLDVLRLRHDDPDLVEEVRRTMERQTQQLTTLVDDLLDVSRITRGKLELRKCRVLLSEILQSAVEASEPFIKEAGHELTITLSEVPIFLEADPHRLAQVISNLLNNAAKYTPDGGHIWLSSQSQGRDAVIAVKDTGLGIPADMRERIFELFSQIDRSMEKGSSGLGIGLTLVKSLVEMHGGTIEVHSEGPARGSEFRLRLPIAADKPVDEAPPGETNERLPPARKRRVLVVDDNAAAAKMLSMIVKMLGNEVRSARDGQEAIEMASEFLPEVVLMDLGMPKMNGYDAARHMRQQPWGKGILLVALSGWGQGEDRQRTKEAGFDYHLVKPAEASELRRLIQESKP